MSAADFIGRFHPLVVHLPIGILLLAVGFEWLSQRERFKNLQPAVPVILWIGTLTAFISCLTGYLLSQSGEYEGELVSWHQWMAISLFVLSLIYALHKSKNGKNLYSKILSAVVLIMLGITGHLGGSLTHGEGYLTSGLFESPGVDVSKINSDTKFYADLVQPLLVGKCYSCHSVSKQKGKLRLDAPEYILKGGKNGAAIVAHSSGESELFNRLLLPINDDDHMPPREKSQLNAVEIEILKRWIDDGADFEKTVGALASKLKMLSPEATAPDDIPDEEVTAGSANIIEKLKTLDVVILPVSQGSNYLSANLINATNIDSALLILSQLSQQLVWLKASGTSLQDNGLQYIARLTTLTRLSLEDTRLTGGSLNALSSLKNLHYLNLSHTKITTEAILSLSSLKNLRALYIYNTEVKKEELPALQKNFPDCRIESGGFQVPFLPTDTMTVKPLK